MEAATPSPGEQVAKVVRRCLDQGFTVDIEGLGAFRPNGTGGFQFVPETRRRVFIAYVAEDFELAERLYVALERAGLDPWLDKKKLLPGQNWARSIERAIEISDYFIACFSSRGSAKRGHFHSELRFALECAARLPLEDVFFIPIRFSKCQLPAQIVRRFQYMDLFPNWEKGLESIISVMRRAGYERDKLAA